MADSVEAELIVISRDSRLDELEDSDSNVSLVRSGDSGELVLVLELESVASTVLKTLRRNLAAAINSATLADVRLEYDILFFKEFIHKQSIP